MKNEMNDLIASLKVYNGVLIMGAGASLKAGMPLYEQFPMLIWRIVDNHPEIKEDFSVHADIRARDIIGNDTDRLMKTFKYISKYPDAIKSFKEQFKQLTSKHHKRVSEVHENICRLIHSGYIKLVISLNWDDLLEVAWTKLYGTEINGEFIQLIKPHGDVKDLSTKWILPHQTGYVSQKNHEQINDVLGDEIYNYLILGYSESDQTIVDEVINPQENQNLFFRISPGNQIDLDASEATQILVDNLITEKDNIWKRVDYTNQNGMERALLGYRLLATDVKSSARLPQINTALKKLENINYTLVQGEPGCGKSITAYQIGYDFQGKNWEVFELIHPIEEKNIFKIFPPTNYQAIYIIDDAQQFSMSFIEQLITSSSEKRKIIINRTRTEDKFTRDSVTISKTESVSEIKDHYLKHSEILTPILNKYYDNITIGNYYFDVPFDRLVENAAKEETPWLFNYNLSGGWKRLKEKFSVIREHNRSDHILALIAIKQIIQLDKAVNYRWLHQSISSFMDSDFDLNSELHFLETEECIIVNGEDVRTIHLQLASEIVRLYYKNGNRVEQEYIVKFIQDDILNSLPNPQGILWFSNLTSATHDDINSPLYSNEFSEKLVTHYLNGITTEGRRDTLLLLDKIDRYNKEFGYKYLLNEERQKLISMIENVDPATLYASGHIFNNMYNYDKQAQSKFISELNFKKFFELVPSLTINDCFPLSAFMDRLFLGMDKESRVDFISKLPINYLKSMIESASNEEIWATSDLCTTICVGDINIVEEFLPLIFDKIINAFHVSVSKTLEQIDIKFFCVFFGRTLFERRDLNEMEQQSLQQFASKVAYDDIVKAFNQSKPREWRSLMELLEDLEKVAPDNVETIINKINLDHIETQSKDLWGTQRRELLILKFLSYYRTKEIDDLLYKYRDKFKHLDAPYVTISEKTVIEFITLGKEVRLFSEDSSDILFGAEAITYYGEKNKELACKILDNNKERITDIFLLAEPINWDSTSSFFTSIAKVNPLFIKQLLDEINVQKVIDSNRIYLSEKPSIRVDDKGNKSSIIYKDNRSFDNINGFKEILHLAINHTERVDLISELQIILDLINTAEHNLPEKYRTLSIEI